MRRETSQPVELGRQPELVTGMCENGNARSSDAERVYARLPQCLAQAEQVTAGAIDGALVPAGGSMTVFGRNPHEPETTQL